MKYVQSFYPYPVTFSSIGKAVPSKDAEGEMKNIIEITDEDLAKLEVQEPMFRQLVNQKKYRVLNHLPDSYKPASYLVNEARQEAAAAKAELEQLKAEMAAEKPAAEKTAEKAEPAKKPAAKKAAKK